MKRQPTAPGAAPAAGRWPWKKEHWDWKSELLTLATILSMITIQCVAINGLYKPNGLISGGVTGVGMLIEYITGFPS